MSRNWLLRTVVSGAAFAAAVSVGHVSLADPCNGKHIVHPEPDEKCGTYTACPTYGGTAETCTSGHAIVQQDEISRCKPGGTSGQHCLDYVDQHGHICTRFYTCERRWLIDHFMCARDVAWEVEGGGPVVSLVYGGYMDTNCSAPHHGSSGGHGGG